MVNKNRGKKHGETYKLIQKLLIIVLARKVVSLLREKVNTSSSSSLSKMELSSRKLYLKLLRET